MEVLKVLIGIVMMGGALFFFYSNYKEWKEDQTDEDNLNKAFNLSIFGTSVVLSWLLLAVGLALIIGWL